MTTAIGMWEICPAWCPIEVKQEKGRAIHARGDRTS